MSILPIKHLRSLVGALAMACATSSFAQADEPHRGLAEGYLGGGSITVRDGGLSLPDWRSMLPGSALLQRDLPESSFDYSWYGPSG
jgi:hypothetical protein